MSLFYTGRTGTMSIGTTAVAKVRDWSIESTLELLSTNTIDSGANTFTPGVVGATGSATLMYYRDDVGALNVGDLFNKVMRTSASGAVETTDKVSFKLGASGNNIDRFDFDAYITSASVSVSTGELTVASVNFTVDGYFDGVLE